MKNKVRKFSAGDIVTGLGAVLVGKALYDKYKSKNDEESDYARKVKEFRSSKEDTAKPIEESKTTKAEPKEREISAGEKRAMAASKGRPELFPEGTTDADKATMYSDNYPTPKPKPAAQNVKVKPASQTFPSDNDALNRRRLEGLKKSTPAASGVKGTQDSSGAKGTQDVGKALGISSGAKGTQTLGERIKGTAESAGKSVVRTPQQRMADAAREVEERRKKEREGMKRGGVVKSSASKRADGIAQRGKTRGRIC